MKIKVNTQYQFVQEQQMYLSDVGLVSLQSWSYWAHTRSRFTARKQRVLLRCVMMCYPTEFEHHHAKRKRWNKGWIYNILFISQPKVQSLHKSFTEILISFFIFGWTLQRPGGSSVSRTRQLHKHLLAFCLQNIPDPSSTSPVVK